MPCAWYWNALRGTATASAGPIASIRSRFTTITPLTTGGPPDPSMRVAPT